MVISKGTETYVWYDAQGLWGTQASCFQYLPEGRFDSVLSSWRKDFLQRLDELPDIEVIFRCARKGSRAKMYYRASDYDRIMDILVETCPDPGKARELERARSIDKQHVYAVLSEMFSLRLRDQSQEGTLAGKESGSGQDVLPGVAEDGGRAD